MEEGESGLWGKGSGSSGVLNKEAIDEQQFVPLKLAFPLRSLHMTSSFLLALSTHHELFLWGQLEAKRVPRPLKLREGVLSVSCGWDHALLTTADRMLGMGSNASQQLGFASPDKFHHQLVEIMLEGVPFVAAGFRQSYLIVHGQLQGCGESKKHELGKASKKNLLWHVLCEQLGVEGKVVRVACGKRFLLLLSEHGQLYAYGCNEENCFNAQQPHFDRPTPIFSQVRDFACGWAHITLLKTDGSVESYGRSNLGQLGHGKETSRVEFAMEEGESVREVGGGSEFTFAVSTQGKLYGWGWNEHFNILPTEEKIIGKPTLVPVPQQCWAVWTNPALTVIQTSP